MKLLSGNSHLQLTLLIANALSMPLSNLLIIRSKTKKISIITCECLQGEDVLIVYAFNKSLSINDSLMELLLLIHACKENHTSSIRIGTLHFVILLMF